MTTTTAAPPASRPATDVVLDRPGWGGPGHRGHYEAWYLTLYDPTSRRALWLRHTLTVPTTSTSLQPGYAALWAFTFEPDGSGVEVMDKHPLWTLSLPADGTLAIGPARLEPGAAKGEVGEGKKRVAWDLKLEGDGEAFRHVTPALYSARLAGSLVATPALALSVSGTVTVGDTRWTLDGARGERGHVFGRRHADRWAWAHVHHFHEGPADAVLEGVSAEVQKLGFTLPVATPLFLRQGGQRLAWDGATAIWSPKASFELGRWEVEATRGDHRVRLKVTAPVEAFVSVEYADPDGSKVYCNHAETADAEVVVQRRARGAWTEVAKLVSRGAVAFEIGQRGVRDERPKRRHDLADARLVGPR